MRIGHEARTSCGGGEVRDLLWQASCARHQVNMSFEPERDPFPIRRPGGDLIIPVGSEGTIGGETAEPASLRRHQEDIRKGFAIFYACDPFSVWRERVRANPLER